MAALTGAQKLFVVTSLACFDTPAEVRDQLKEEFGADASLQQIVYYDPTKGQGSRELSPELKALFAQTRTAFLANEIQSAIQHRAVRFRRLERLYSSRRVRNSPELALKVLEQAAKEDGGLYTNRSTVTVLRQMAKEVEGMSDADLLAALADGSGGSDPAPGAGGGGAP